MFKLCASLLLAGAAFAGPAPSHHKSRTECHVVYDTVHNKQCSTYYEEACHEEYDVIVDTTYIEECADIVTEHCSEVSKQVHHSSAVVGHDSQLIKGSGYHKREADAEPGYGYKPHNNLQCFSKPHKQCHQRPVQKQRQECHEEYDTIVDTTYIEECQDIVTKHCQETHKQVHHSSAVVGHDSKVISHGSYHGKREAEAEADASRHGGYSSGPQCQQHVEKKCHKVPKQNSRKVARPVCKTVVDTTYIEECEETFTTECTQTQTQVHHSSAVVGHDSQVVSYGSHYGKRSADGYGYGPQCQQHVERQCHKVPQQHERKVPRPVCVKVPKEQCHPVAHKVARKVCSQYGGHGHGHGHGGHGHGHHGK